MSFLDELQEEIKHAEFAVRDCPFARSGQVHRLKVFLADHGPRLLAAVRLAESCIEHDCDHDLVAMSAYRAACASETGNIDRGGV